MQTVARTIVQAIMMLSLAVTDALAQDPSSQAFLRDAIEGNFAEIRMGELAQKNGQSGGIKTFGEALQNEHRDANSKALEAARSLGIDPPTGPGAMANAASEQLAKLTGPEFDRAFARHIIADHRKAIEKYEQASKRQDAAGSYATATLQVLRKHLQTAEDLAKDAR